MTTSSWRNSQSQRCTQQLAGALPSRSSRRIIRLPGNRQYRFQLHTEPQRSKSTAGEVGDIWFPDKIMVVRSEESLVECGKMSPVFNHTSRWFKTKLGSYCYS